MALNAVIGALRVNLGLNSAGFQKGADDVDRRIKKMGRDFAKVSAVFATAGAGLAVFAKSAGNVIDAQSKLAQSLQTTTSSVQVLTRAGDLAGVSLSGIEQLAKDLTRRLSQAADGTGPAVKALERLGLSAESLSKIPLDQRIARINQAINDFVPAAQRAAVAGQLFGEEGSIAASRLEPDVIAQATAELEKFGVTVSDVDADQIERANDAFSQLGLITEGLGNQLAVSLAPALESISNAAADFFAVTGTGGRIIRAFGENIDRIAASATALVGIMGVRYVAAFAAARGATTALAAAMLTLRTALISTGIGALAVVVGELGLRLAETSDKFQFFKAGAEDVQAPSFDAAAAVAALNGELDAFALDAAPKSGQAAINLANDYVKLAEAALRAAEAEVAKNKALLQSTLANPNIAGRNERSRTERIQREITAGLNTIAEAEKALERARTNQISTQERIIGSTYEYNEALGDTTRTTRLVVEDFESLGRAAGGAGGNAFDQLSDSASGLNEELAKTSNILDSIVDGFRNGGISGALDAIASKAQSSFGNVLTDAFGQGGGGFAGVLTSISGSFSKVGTAISGVFSGGGLSALSGLASAALPIIGAIGAVGSLLKGLFGSTKIIGKGFDIGFEDGVLVGGEFTTKRRKALFGLISSTKTQRTAFEAELAEAIQGQANALRDTVGAVFKTIGVDVSDAVLGGVDLAIQRIDTRGKSEEEVAEAFSDVLSDYTDSLSQAVGGIAFESATLLAQVVSVLEPAGQMLFGTLSDMADAAQDLAARTGGALASQVAFFADNFFTEAEKFTILQDAVSDVFGDLGAEVPKTIEAFKELTLSQNLMTEAGREAYAALLQIAPQFQAITAAASDFGAFDFSNKRFDTALEEQIAQIGLARNYDLTQIQALGGSTLTRDPESPTSLLDRIADTLDRMEVLGIPERA